MIKSIKGLSGEQVAKSRRENGDNALVKEKTKGFFRKFIENLSDPIIKVLLFAVALEVIFTFGNCNWLEIGGIMIAVLIATVVSTASEHGSEAAFAKMQEDSGKAYARALRDGVLEKIPVSDIVVGDVVYIASGELAPADGVMISGKVTVDQSALNGESREITKIPKAGKSVTDLSSESKIFRGSLITSGEGVMLTEKVGGATYYGMVAKDVQTETRESPLKLRLGQLASQISKLGYIMALIVGLTYLFFAYVVDNGFSGEEILSSFKNIPYLIATLSHALTLMITVVVVAVPEGLPMMITVVLSANMKKMISDNIMVKKLVGIETAGSLNVLFTDKTGTLTEGKTVCDRIITSSGTYKSVDAMSNAENLKKYLILGAKYGAEYEGNSTDKALSSFFKCELPSAKVLSRIPFTSERKYSSVTFSDGVTVLKGAPELVFSVCSGVLDNSGENSPSQLKEMEKAYKTSAAKGERVIAIALSYDGEKYYLLALAILKDRVRAGVREAVANVTRAGVQVVMITGDSKETASAIAYECGIIKNSAREVILSRDELDKMTDEELAEILPRLRVVARALPQDKTRLVRVSQAKNLVVGMTGDGVNDAPSLKLADVGFAMGGGTDIAKGAADIVILDNSFLAITKTVLYGRTIFKSIRKFISFQLMMNIAACGVSLLGQFIGIDNPITIIQMLWVNIIMDTLGGLAFSGEAPLDYYMHEKPKSRSEKILSRDMLHQIIFTGGYTLLLCMSFLYFDVFKQIFRADSADTYFLTGFYALFVFSGIFNCFNSRSERMSLLSNIGKNKPFLIIMAAISVIQILMIYFGGDVFRSAPLSFRELITVILLAATVIPFDFLRRIFKRLG